MKKLLTLLLTMFMIVAGFTTKLFADTKTIANILPNDYPIDFNFAWTNGNKYSYINGSDLQIGQHFFPLSLELTGTGNSYSKDNIDFYGDICSITFNLDDNGKLINFVFTTSSTSFADNSGTYTKPVITIGTIMPDNFPTFNTSFSWINENYSDVYYSYAELIKGLQFHLLSDFVANFRDIEVNKNDNNNYECSNVSLHNEINQKMDFEFIMDGNKFKSFVISGLTGDYAYGNGTYKPGIGLTNIMTNSLPLESEVHWTSGEKELYLIDEDGEKFLHFKKGSNYAETQMYTLSNLSLLKKSESSYICKDFIYTDNKTDEVMTLTFNFNGTNLISINAEFTGSFSELSGTYIGPLKVIDILETVEGGFPITFNSGWTNNSGSKSYRDNANEVLMIMDDDVPFNTALIKDGNNYKYEFETGYYYIFNMVSDELVSITETKNNTTFSPYVYTNPRRSIIVGSSSSIEFVVNGTFIDPADANVTVLIDDVLLNKSNYTVAHGSTKVVLKANYVKKLSVGSHTITICLTGYDPISQDFIVSAVPSPSSKHEVPNTGVNG